MKDCYPPSSEFELTCRSVFQVIMHILFISLSVPFMCHQVIRTVIRANPEERLLSLTSPSLKRLRDGNRGGRILRRCLLQVVGRRARSRQRRLCIESPVAGTVASAVRHSTKFLALVMILAVTMTSRVLDGADEPRRLAAALPGPVLFEIILARLDMAAGEEDDDADETVEYGVDEDAAEEVSV